MKLLALLLLACSLGAQPKPPKLSDPFAKMQSPFPGAQFFFILIPSPFEELVAQEAKDAQACEVYRLRQFSELYVPDYMSYMDVFGEIIALSPCGELRIPDGMSYEQALKRALRLWADEARRQGAEQARKDKIIREFLWDLEKILKPQPNVKASGKRA